MIGDDCSGGSAGGAKPGGGSGSAVPGGLGGLFGGASAGSVLSDGLGNLLKDFEKRGQGKAAQSWVGTGANEPISPDSLEAAVGANTLETLAKQTGMNKDELLDALSKHLPDLVDRLTPQGRLPTQQEASRLL